MEIRNFDPGLGQAFQGDVAIIPMPASIAIAKTEEIKPIDGRLILQEGEVSGHHHAITLPISRNFRADTRQLGDPATATRDKRLRKAFRSARIKPLGARLYRDTEAINALRSLGLITRTDLAVGCLVVEGESVVVSHEEHDSIRLPHGNYYVGRQVESAGAEERVVLD